MLNIVLKFFSTYCCNEIKISKTINNTLKKISISIFFFFLLLSIKYRVWVIYKSVYSIFIYASHSSPTCLKTALKKWMRSLVPFKFLKHVFDVLNYSFMMRFTFNHVIHYINSTFSFELTQHNYVEPVDTEKWTVRILMGRLLCVPGHKIQPIKYVNVPVMLHDIRSMAVWSPLCSKSKNTFKTVPSRSQ